MSTSSLRPFNPVAFAFTLILNFVLLAGCDGGGESSSSLVGEEFEPGYFYYSDSRQIELFKSHAVIAAQFNGDVSVDQAKEMAREYGLALFEGVQPAAKDWDRLLEQEAIFLRLPTGARLEDYVTEYPKSERSGGFGNHPNVRFAVPSYAFTPSGEVEDRYFIFDEILVQSDAEVREARTYFVERGLDVLDIQRWDGYAEYTLRVTAKAPKSTLPMANELYTSSLTAWSLPNAFVHYVLVGGCKTPRCTRRTCRRRSRCRGAVPHAPRSLLAEAGRP